MSGSEFKRFPLAGFLIFAAILLAGCGPIDDEIAHYVINAPTSSVAYTPVGPSCTELEKTAQETLDGALPPPATAKFSADDRRALASEAFSYLCELARDVGWRQSATTEEWKAAEFLIDHFTEFGYRPETQEFQVRIGPLQRRSSNIIAELPGQGEDVIIISAHYDTVRGSVGANDNASGVSVLLTLAERLAQPPWSNEMVSNLPFTLRFIAFGSEETGLDGSWHYVAQLAAEELDSIRIVINLDVVGSGSYLLFRGRNNRWVTEHLSEAAEREGVSYMNTTADYNISGRSDEAPFQYRGISAVRFFANDTERANTRNDAIEFINPVLLGDTAVLILDLLAYLETCKSTPTLCASL